MHVGQAWTLIERIAKRENIEGGPTTLRQAFEVVGQPIYPGQSFLEVAWNVLGVPADQRTKPMDKDEAWSLIEQINARIKTDRPSADLSRAFRVVGYKRDEDENLLESARNAIAMRVSGEQPQKSDDLVADEWKPPAFLLRSAIPNQP